MENDIVETLYIVRWILQTWNSTNEPNYHTIVRMYCEKAATGDKLF